MYRLLFEDRSLSREPYVARDPSVVIGRDEGCSLRLVAGGVSGRHAAIEQRENGYYIRDLGGVNGVRVNGLSVGDQRLSSGDEIEFGSVRVRFEVVHELPGHRRTFDLMQVIAALIVVLIGVGQILVLKQIFSEPHLRQVRTDSKSVATPSSSARPGGPAVSQSSIQSLQPLERGVNQVAPAANPAVLNRMIRIARADRRGDADNATLQIQVRAQVGERVLDPALVAIAVQLVARKETRTVWMEIPRTWENFATRSFSIPLSGAPAPFQGYVVRTYYRKQLQDAVSVPPELLATVPPPIP